MPEKLNPQSHKQESSFYGNLVENYLTEVNRFVPGYSEEILPLVTNLIVSNIYNGAFLDIGSGVGNVAEMIMNRGMPQSVDLIEPSAPMIAASQRRLGDKKWGGDIKFHQMSALDFQTSPSTFNAILSNLVIHNMRYKDKSQLINNIYQWLKKDGIFVWTDLVSFDDHNELELCLAKRREIALALGATIEFAEENFRKEREEDHMITVPQMTELLIQAGFQTPQILWTKHNTVVISAKK